MGPFAKILVYVVCIVVFAACLTPPVVWACHALAHATHTTFLLQVPVGRYFNRVILFPTLLGMPILLRTLHIHRWADLHLMPNPRSLKDFFLGCAIGFVGVALLAAALLGADVVRWHFTYRYDAFLWALIPACIVPILEEVLFRGAFLGALRRVMTPLKATLVLTTLFAAVHFVKPTGTIGTQTQATWDAGFAYVGGILSRFAQPLPMLKEFLSLWCVGFALALATLRTQSLFLAIGLHASFVYALKTWSHCLTRVEAQSLWIGKQPLAGLGPLLMLVFVCCVIAVCVPPRK